MCYCTTPVSPQIQKSGLNQRALNVNPPDDDAPGAHRAEAAGTPHEPTAPHEDTRSGTPQSADDAASAVDLNDPLLDTPLPDGEACL